MRARFDSTVEKSLVEFDPRHNIAMNYLTGNRRDRATYLLSVWPYHSYGMDRSVLLENIVQSQLLCNMNSTGLYTVTAWFVSRERLPVDEGEPQSTNCCRIRRHGACRTGPDGNIEDLRHTLNLSCGITRAYRHFGRPGRAEARSQNGLQLVGRHASGALIPLTMPRVGHRS